MKAGIELHPHYALLKEARPDAQRIKADICPACLKKIKKFGAFVTLVDDGNDGIVGLSSVCPTCARRIRNSPTQRAKLTAAIKRTLKLAVETGGHA